MGECRWETPKGSLQKERVKKEVTPGTEKRREGIDRQGASIQAVRGPSLGREVKVR